MQAKWKLLMIGIAALGCIRFAGATDLTIHLNGLRTAHAKDRTVPM